jgi:hypothetical protein
MTTGRINQVSYPRIAALPHKPGRKTNYPHNLAFPIGRNHQARGWERARLLHRLFSCSFSFTIETDWEITLVRLLCGNSTLGGQTTDRSESNLSSRLLSTSAKCSPTLRFHAVDFDKLCRLTINTDAPAGSAVEQNRKSLIQTHKKDVSERAQKLTD